MHINNILDEEMDTSVAGKSSSDNDTSLLHAMDTSSINTDLGTSYSNAQTVLISNSINCESDLINTTENAQDVPHEQHTIDNDSFDEQAPGNMSQNADTNTVGFTNHEHADTAPSD